MLLLVAVLLQDIHVDEVCGFSICVPRGWSVTASGDDVAALRMSGGDAMLVVRRQVPIRTVNGGTPSLPDLARQLRATNAKKWADYEQTRIEAGAARVVIEGAWTDGDRKMRSLQCMVSDAAGFWVLTWIAPAESFDAHRPEMEASRRSFAAGKK